MDKGIKFESTERVLVCVDWPKLSSSVNLMKCKCSITRKSKGFLIQTETIVAMTWRNVLKPSVPRGLFVRFLQPNAGTQKID